MPVPLPGDAAGLEATAVHLEDGVSAAATAAMPWEEQHMGSGYSSCSEDEGGTPQGSQGGTGSEGEGEAEGGGAADAGDGRGRHSERSGAAQRALSPEDDHFYDTQEFEQMEARFQRFFCLPDHLGDCASIRQLIGQLRSFAAELEGLAGAGWEMDADECLDDGGLDFALRNAGIEREEWRLRRRRRRAARGAARREQQQRAAVHGEQQRGVAGSEDSEMPQAASEEAGVQGPATAAGKAAMPQSFPPAFDLC